MIPHSIYGRFGGSQAIVSLKARRDILGKSKVFLGSEVHLVNFWREFALGAYCR